MRLFFWRDEMTIKVVVPVSGGKDSQACLKLAIGKYGADNVLGLFCDTKFEHPLTYKHISDLADRYGVAIAKVNAGSVESKVLKYGRFPGGGARHCTDELKIRPSRDFYREFAKKNGPFEIWYGVRSDESAQRTKRYAEKFYDELYPVHEYMPNKFPKYLTNKYGIYVRMPILEWTYDEVINFLDGEQNPLYDMGFDRVGCFPCLAGGDAWKEKAFFFDETGREHYQKVIWLEQQIGKSVWTSKGGKVRNCDSNGCSICSM
jgi:3'-phosphoadenosine 5'-phosphosulfate sulfotransferase (PAPS reductase)/FAD synthetase